MTVFWIVLGMTLLIGSPWVIRHRHRLVAGLSLGSRPPGRRRAVKKTPAKAKLPYEAVTIRPCLGCCMAASRLEGQRFLIAESPELPLSGCDNDECSCRYDYREDRRSKGGRRAPVAQIENFESRLGGEEKRKPENGDRRRRKEDIQPRSYFNDY